MSIPRHDIEFANETELFAARDQAVKFADEMNTTARARHAAARPRVQAYLKSRGLRHRWADLEGFLSFWDEMDLKEQFTDELWSELQLPAPRPPDLLSFSEPWRLMLDGEGVLVFQGAVAFTQPKQVQRMDLLQLPYLSVATPRVMVTRDGPFFNAVQAVTHRRYTGGRVCSPEEIVALAR